MGELSEFALEVKNALARSGFSQTRLSAEMPFNRPKISEMCNGHYLPSDETAQRMIEVLGMDQDRTLRLLREARIARRALPSASWDHPLPPEIVSLLRAQVSAAEILPYRLPGARPVSLATLYVRQELGSRIEESPPDERMADPGPMPRPDDRDPGWRSRNPERFSSLSAFKVRPPSRPISAALDEHEHLLVTGGPGQGKSTLTLRLAAEIAGAWLGGTAPLAEPVIPLRLPARELATRLKSPFNEALAASLLAEYGQMLKSGLTPELLSVPVAGCRWLLLIDAVDEVADPADRDTLVHSLARWASDRAYRFLVTSRPLEGAGLAPLHRASAARYELQPFDAESLRLFATHWFGSAEAGTRFLDQVRHGQLEELIQVPLLAAIAAIVFDQHGDRPLPGNKYGLYEVYLEYLTSARSHPDLTELLEHLGLTRVQTDTPLIHSAQTWTAERTPVDKRPPDWRSTVIAQLLATSLLVMRAGNLQFLHHSFAEHLAATAKARQLPVPFDAEDPLWLKALHDTRYGWTTDHARDVVLHYAHLHRDQADVLLEWLHHDTGESQQLAADLLALRIPVSAQVIESFLDTVMAWAMTTTYRAGEILRKVAQAAPTEWLQALLTESNLPWKSRVEAAKVLCTRPHLPQWADAVKLLQLAMRSADLRLSVRLEAAQGLTKAGAEQGEAAAEGLKAILMDTLSNGEDLRAAAVALADLGEEHRKFAVERLTSAVDSTTRSPSDVMHAAAGLAEIGIEFHDQVVAVFRRIAQDDTVLPKVRRDAALALGALGPTYLAAAAAALEYLIGHKRFDLKAQASEAAVALAKLGPEYIPVAAGHLLELLTSPWVQRDGFFLHHYATDLVKLGTTFHPHAAEHLRRVVADPTATANDRLWAAMGLAELGPDYHQEAAKTFRKLHDDPMATEFDRWGPLRELAMLGREFREEALGMLQKGLADPSLESEERYWIITSLMNIGPDQHPLTLATCRLVLGETTDVKRSAHTRVIAVLVNLSPADRDRAVETLREIVNCGTANVLALVAAASQLYVLAPQFEADAVSCLRILARSVTEDNQRNQIMEALSVMGSASRDEAARLMLAELSSQLSSEQRISSAARMLPRLGVKYRMRAVQLLRSICDRPDSLTARRRAAAAALAEFGLEFVPEAGRALLGTITDPAADLYVRADAVSGLMELGPQFRAEAISALRALLAAQPEAYSWPPEVEKLVAATEESRCLLVEAMRTVLSSSSFEVLLRQRVAACMPRLDENLFDEAKGHLVRQVTDVTLAAKVRAGAAWELVRLETPSKDFAIRHLAEFFADEGSGIAARCAVAKHLVQLDRSRWRHVSDVLGQLHVSSSTKSADRFQVLLSLQWIAAIRRDAFARGLLEVARDPIASASTRMLVADWLQNNEFVSRATVEGLLHELSVDAMARPSQRGRDERLLRGIIGAPEFDHATKLEARAELACLGPECKVEVAEGLRSSRELLPLGNLDGRYRLEAVALAVAIVNDPAETQRQRWQAAVALDVLRAEPDEATIAVFRGALELPSYRAVRAATALARFGQDIGLVTLRRVVADPRVNGYLRVRAAKALAECSPADRPAAVSALDAIAGGGSKQVRWRAAKTLGEMAPECRDKVASHLRDIMATTPSARINAAAVIVEVDRRNLERAAIVLREAAKEPRFKRRALFALGELARPYSDEAVIGLRELMAEADWTTRWRAAEAMAKLRRDLREEASIVAREVANDEKAPWHVRRRAAAGLAKWSAICRDEARRILRELDGT